MKINKNNLCLEKVFSKVKNEAHFNDIVQWTTFSISSDDNINKDSIYKVCCPFCPNEYSMDVNPQKKITYCHNCHTAADIFVLAAKAEECSTKDAAFMLAEEYDIDLSDCLSKEEVVDATQPDTESQAGDDSTPQSV